MFLNSLGSRNTLHENTNKIDTYIPMYVMCIGPRSGSEGGSKFTKILKIVVQRLRLSTRLSQHFSHAIIKKVPNDKIKNYQ